jgi:ethanolamine utilization cobalamin adenosyltransferase
MSVIRIANIPPQIATIVTANIVVLKTFPKCALRANFRSI